MENIVAVVANGPNEQRTSALPGNGLATKLETGNSSLPKSEEKLVEKYLKRICDSNNWLCLKQKVANKRGWPDRTVIAFNPTHYYVECKDRGKRPRPDQEAVHKELRRRGVTVLLIDTKEKVKQFEFHVKFNVPIPPDSNLTHPDFPVKRVRKPKLKI